MAIESSSTLAPKRATAITSSKLAPVMLSTTFEPFWLLDPFAIAPHLFYLVNTWSIGQMDIRRRIQNK